MVNMCCAIRRRKQESHSIYCSWKNGRDPALDGISAEILKLGFDASVKWLKELSDRTWKEEFVRKDWRKQLIVHCTRKVIVLSVATISALRYANDMFLVVDCWYDMKTMLESVEWRCYHDMSLTISTSKSRSLQFCPLALISSSCHGISS